jgi:hypothetical protein
VEFKPVTGWTIPTNQTVTITDGLTTTADGTYVQQTGSLTVTISPTAAVTAGAQWRVDAGAWQNSGTTVSGLVVGSHTVEFKDIAGWTKPGNQDIALTVGQNTCSGVYKKMPTISLTAARPNASETGARGRFTVTRTGSTLSGLGVRYTVGGSAENGVDYREISGKVVIRAGASSANMWVVPVDDTALEGNETVVVTLAQKPSYQVGSAKSATVTIADNVATITITAPRPNASEARGKGRFTVTRTGSILSGLVVRYTVGGSAENGVDYRKLSGKVVIRAGDFSANVRIVPVDDTAPEESESVVVTLADSPNYKLGSPNTASVSISDND